MPTVHLSRVFEDWSYLPLARLLDRDVAELFPPYRLCVTIAGLDVTHPVECELGPPLVSHHPSLWTIAVRMQALSATRWFPRLEVDVQVRPVGKGVELALEGRYITPAGPVGWVGDVLVLRRVAQASLNNYLNTIGDRIGERLLSTDALTGIPI